MAQTTNQKVGPWDSVRRIADLVTPGGGGGSGDVVGPASSTDNAVVRFNGTTGKLIQNSGVVLDDQNFHRLLARPVILAPGRKARR